MAYNTTEVYPQRPHRPNFTDIRTMQIFDPVVIDCKVDINTTWVQLYSAGATLENGVRIKNTWADSNPIAVSTTATKSTTSSGLSI